MIALDTNVLLRLLTHDDPARLAALEQFFAAHDGESFFVTDVVLLEVVWTLRAAFRWDRDRIAAALRRLSDKPDVEFEDRQRVADAVAALERGGDFADALIVVTARQHGCAKLISFDRELARRYPDLVERPS